MMCIMCVVFVLQVVLSTNITETSVTVNDISVVVDCGTHKEMQYDPHGTAQQVSRYTLW